MGGPPQWTRSSIPWEPLHRRISLHRIDAAKLRELMEEDCPMGFKVMKSIGKVLASRLNHTRIILVGERGLSHLSEY